MTVKIIARLGPALAIFIACCLTPPSGAAAVINGVNYIGAASLGKHFGLHAHWLEPEKRLLLENAETRLALEINQREMIFDGRQVWMGSPAVLREHDLWVSLIDAEKLIRPLLRLGLDRPPAVHTIVIDPGHGLPDNGAENRHLGLKERVLTLDAAFRLKKILEAQGYKVVMTRTTDKAISPDKKVDLRMRVELAARAKADLFISIHFNFFDVAAVHGTETYRPVPRYQPPVSRSVIRVEDNEANPSNKNDYWNTVLGYCIHRALIHELGSADRGMRPEDYAVLRLAPCPAVLIESGYLTNDAEGRKIATPVYRERIAEGIAAGIRAYAELGRPPGKPVAAPARASAR